MAINDRGIVYCLKMASMSAPQGTTALYRIYDADRALLYVGIAAQFGARWRQHALSQPWWPSVRYQDVAWYDTRDEAHEAEKSAILSEKPLHNVRHTKDPATGLPGDSGRGPGRPVVGEAINVRLGDLLQQVDTWAAAHGSSRAAALRTLVAAGLASEFLAG